MITTEFGEIQLPYHRSGSLTFISDETLRATCLVARHQSITTVAEQLNKVPSAISYITKKTEENLGIELFICRGRYIELSLTGNYFIEHSKAVLGDLEALKCNTVLIHDGIEREPTIMVNSIIPGNLLVIFIQDFEQQFTSTTLMVSLEVYNGYWDALHNKRADLVYGAPRTVPSNEGITSEPARQMGWDFTVNPLHPLAAKRHPLGNSESRRYPAVCIRDASINSPPMQTWLLEGRKPIFILDFATAIVLAEQNVDIGYIPRHLALPLLNNGKLLKKPIHEHKHATRLFPAARSDSMGKTCQWCIEYLRNPQLMTQFVFNR